MIRPVNGNIVIRRDKAGEVKTPSGIIIPNAHDRKSSVGHVVAISDPAPSTQSCVNPVDGIARIITVGDKIIFDDRYSTEIEVDSNQFAIVSEERVLAVL